LKTTSKFLTAAFITALAFILSPFSSLGIGATSLYAVSPNSMADSISPAVPLMSGLQFFLLLAAGFFVWKLIYSLKKKKK